MSNKSTETLNLKNEYINDVLKIILPEISSNKIYSLSMSGSTDQLSLNFNANTFKEFKNSYKCSAKSYIHFTSLRALHSILNEKALRLYNLNNVNDPNEFNFLTKDLISNEFTIKNIKENSYIMSMCDSAILKSDEILNLWRLYGGGGTGVAIEFNIQLPNNSYNDFLLSNIQYKKPDIEAFKLKHEIFEKKHNVKMKLDGIFKIPGCLHKSPYYKIENEVRLLLIDNETNINRSSAMTNDSKPCFYDFNSKNERVSFYKLPLNQKDIYNPYIEIKSIQLGFKFSEKHFNKIKKHLIDNIFWGQKANGEKLSNFPEIKISPLTNMYN